MTPQEFSQKCAETAIRAEAAQPYSEARAACLDELGNLWTEYGYPVVGQSWHDAAEFCRNGF